MLVIIRGLPGAGKSTFGKKNFPDCKQFENDMYHIHNGVYQFDITKQKKAVEWCFNQVCDNLLKGFNVVVSNTFTRIAFIKPYVDFCKSHGIPYKVIRLNTQYGNIHNVPEDVLRRMEMGFEDYKGEVTVG